MSDVEEIYVEIGSHHRVRIEKLFGSAAFADIRIACDVATCEWVIERQSIVGRKEKWTEVARFSGDFKVTQ